MTLSPSFTQLQSNVLATAAEKSSRAIPPAWPLASTVAVNPYLGQTEEDLAQVAARLTRVAGASVTMPRSYYLGKIAAGTITDEDLTAALNQQTAKSKPSSIAELKALARDVMETTTPLPTVATLAAKVSDIDWPAFIAERFGAWASAYFDEGQAQWAAPKSKSAFAAWRTFAIQDLTAEIIGLKGFSSYVSDAPETAHLVLARAVSTLGLDQASLETYFHQLLMTLGGWSQLARYKLWQQELAGSTDGTLIDLLAIRILWEEALYDQYSSQIADDWADVSEIHASPLAPSQAQVVDVVLQEAAERAAQRSLTSILETPSLEATTQRPLMHAVFCIDVRSEVFRRSLESLSPIIKTSGFAGFFGIFTAHRRFASDVKELRLPVLLNPNITSGSGSTNEAEEEAKSRIKARSKRAWGRFKLAAVSSFAFVEASGPVYIAKLVRDALSLHGNKAPNDPAPRFESDLTLETKINAAETVLRAMSLTEHFARLILLVGHGANVVNNPHASALHCGACGGYSGEANARLLAGLLNTPEVRQGLHDRKIIIPEDTYFVGSLHDTTTDLVTLYDQDTPSTAHTADLKQARNWLKSAGALTRTERMLHLSRAKKERHVISRSRDWAEVRPEWGLAGCKAFIAAPRARTLNKNLEGRAFLHDYDWTQDKDFNVLELIMTAPVVVASWISLQYYGSTVSPETFGGGNKLLHNITGGVGVVEGNGGTLRAGLPWQSVYDGKHYMHEPIRLSVCIEAPHEAMTEILRRHEGVRALFDNRWLSLFALGSNGQISWRYTRKLQWTEVNKQDESIQKLRAVG